ncbi:MAG: alpha-N-acetylglucosaminidase [Akkermansia sp.]|nr:alpha-N-acetylglucosaminidase [Akkermansia sp.]
MRFSATKLALMMLALAIPTITADCTQEPQQAQPATAVSETAAAEALVKRLTPQFANRVHFSLDANAASPTISGKGASILITAANERECIRAYGHYLRNIAHVHFSWNGDNTTGAQFIIPTTQVKVPAALPFNYAYNYCTLSYTGAHWDKARWERELDLLALNGFQYVLVTSGLEKVWQNFLKDLGYPEEKIMAFIPNPAYSAWWNMGNLEGEGGPITQSLIDSEAELGRFIVQRLRELGMEPVLQGYVGFVPHDLPQEGINGKILGQGKWCGYNRPAVLQPTAEAFPGIAALWYKHLHEVYGITGKIYGGDLFHEGGNKGNTDLTAAAKAVQNAMIAASEDAVWLLQAWGGNPDKRLMNGCDPKHTIILALNKNLAPHGPLKFNYNNLPYVWCELANFGGNTGLYGGAEILEKLSSDITNAIGIGLISEGLETNPLYYALLYERINNRGIINRESFLAHYAQARYGTQHEPLMNALQIIMNGLYKPDKMREGCLENIMCARPNLEAKKASTWSNPHMYYSPQEVESAARLMLQAGQELGKELTSLDTYRYDLADLCRQVLADRARTQLARCKTAYDQKDAQAFAAESEAFLQLIRDTASVLRCSEHFLLGLYLQGAENRATTPEDKQANTESLRRLFTTWRPDISVLNDYAHRQYAELMQHHYLERWKAYFELCSAQLAGTATAADAGTAEKQVTTNNGEAVEYVNVKNPRMDAIDTAFATAKIPLLKKPTGDIMELAAKILSK